MAGELGGKPRPSPRQLGCPYLPQDSAYGKLAAMTEAARLLRAELGN